MSKTKKTTFEDHLNIVEAGQKTASANAVDGDNQGSLLDKLASELDDGSEKTAAESVTDEAAPSNEGEVQPADSSVAGAAEPVVAATEGVATPQTEIAGGNNAEAMAGEQPAATKQNEGTAISAGDGKVTDANMLHKTPAAVAEAVEPTNKTASDDQIKEAEAIGTKIAEAFYGHIEKLAKDEEYTEALNLLDETGLLEGYNIKDSGMNKTAEEDNTDYLAKIAAKNETLTRDDIIGGARQYLGLVKEAQDAEEQGRQDARDLVAFLEEYEQTKTASAETEKTAEAKPAEETPAAEAKETKTEKPAEETKVATLLKDKDVVSAVKLLKEKGVI